LRYCRSRFFTFVFFMQKLTGISSGQNNKICRIIHHEPNKIGFAFFRFVYDFIPQFTRIRKSLLLFQLRFCSRDPGKKIFFAMWSWRGWPARVGQIPARFAGVRPGKGRGMARGSTRVDLSRSWGGEGSGGSTNGGGPAAAAAAIAPARMPVWLGNPGFGRLW
jgi:hypothetical protein